MCSMKRLGVAPADIDILLISHLHGDHYGGLPFLLLEYLWESQRRKPVKIAGPPHLEERTWRLFNTMFPFSSGDLERLRRTLHFIELDPAHKARLGKVQVESLRVPHMKRDLCLAFKRTVGDGATWRRTDSNAAVTRETATTRAGAEPGCPAPGRPRRSRADAKRRPVNGKLIPNTTVYCMSSLRAARARLPASACPTPPRRRRERPSRPRSAQSCAPCETA